MSVAANVTVLCQYLISGICLNYTNLWPVTPSQGQCESWFTGAVPLGNQGDTQGNTIGCRQTYATMGQAAGSAYYCKFASFTGGGVCGANPLNNTCNAIMTICAGQSTLPYTTVGDCLTDLNPLNSTIGGIQGPAGARENSLECRAYHATAGILTGSNVHCGHVPLNSTQCNLMVTPQADHYCGLEELTCTGAAHQQYGQGGVPLAPANHMMCCAGSFNAFPVGAGVTFGASLNDQSGRMYHITANILNGWNTAHCFHSGPSGGGVVGGSASSRASWMYIANNSVCATAGNMWVYLQIAQAMNMWPVQLMTVVPQDSALATYSVAVSALGANTDTCRIYHLNFAAGGAPAHCSHGSILGGGQCPANSSIPACLLVMTACPNAYTSAAACQADFQPYFTNGMLGNPCGPLMATPQIPTDDSVACRIYYATMAITSVGMNQTASATNCMNAQIKGATGCNVSALPGGKSSAASLTISSGLALLMMLW